MKEPYEKGVAICAAPSFALGAVKRPAKRKQGERWAGYRASKICNQGADAVTTAEGNTASSASASCWPALRSRRPHARLETPCTRTGRPRRRLKRTVTPRHFDAPVGLRVTRKLSYRWRSEDSARRVAFPEGKPTCANLTVVSPSNGGFCEVNLSYYRDNLLRGLQRLTASPRSRVFAVDHLPFLSDRRNPYQYGQTASRIQN
jgi:hypothetical protein